MALTVKQLKEFLASAPDDAIVHTEQNLDIVHVVVGDSVLLSTKKPIGTCNRTGEYVYPSKIEGYSAFSPALDEDLYKFEWTPFNDEENE